ncbi:MAG TPA: 1-phosphofructokinase family hexose kinase [Pyrinomonadaceae bacterium]|nr:1-phosphofructokinase family hexose kinase [Pyrinomonadaceae bacterium]
MIICVSANPAIDRRVRLKKMIIGEVNRVEATISFAGGKAAHVAMAAKTLGEEVIWIGFLGGATGEKVERQLTEFGIKVISIPTISETRCNDEIIDGNGVITEILENGGVIQPTELQEFYQVCEKTFAQYPKDFQAVFSGSLPPNVPTNFYFKLIKSAQSFGGTVLLDTSGNALSKGLEAKPDFVKPNKTEAKNICNFEINNMDSAIKAAKILQTNGAKNVALSLGEDGLIWLNENSKILMAQPPKVQVKSTVGCGDATVAAFAIAEARKLNEKDTLKLAVACGSANCLAELPAQIKLKDVENLLPKVAILDF